MQTLAATASLLSIGDEILFGKTCDTNAFWLADSLARAGIRVLGQEAVGDDQAAIVAALDRACDRAALVVVTGGLGPTEDDRTRHALADLLGVPLVEDAGAWEEIQGYCTSRLSGAVSQANRRQALVPEGAMPLANDRGTAPGLLARHRGSVIACLPGVPHEMRAMAERLLDRGEELLGAWQRPAMEEIHFAGIGESAAQDLLGPLLCGDADLTVGITAQRDMHLCVRACGDALVVAARLAAIRAALPGHVLDPGCVTIAAAVVAACRARSLSLTVAESCTCGHILAQLGAVPGVSAVLREGLIAYHNAVKVARLGVDPALISAHGVVSQPVAEAMAKGAREHSGADCAIVTTDIAGPDGGSAEKPVGLVWWAVARGEFVRSGSRVFPGNRQDIQERAASWALLQMWLLLRG